MDEIMQEMNEEEDTQKDKYLIFSLDDEDFGIEIRHVIEIVGIQQITPIPELSDYIRGVINLRGKIIPVMDVRIRFRKSEREYDDRTCIIVVEIKDICVGLIIDRVLEVVNITEDNISEPPQMSKKNTNDYIKGIGKAGSGVKLLLDCEKLLTQDDTEIIAEAI